VVVPEDTINSIDSLSLGRGGLENEWVFQGAEQAGPRAAPACKCRLIWEGTINSAKGVGMGSDTKNAA